MPPSVPVQRRQQQQQHLNGKFPTRVPAEPVSPYTPRKPASTNSGPSNQHPVIPNIPNLSHLSAGSSSNYGKSNHIGNYQHMAIDKRRAAEAASKEHQRRTSESDKIALQQQQQQRLEANSAQLSKQQQSRFVHTNSLFDTSYFFKSFCRSYSFYNILIFWFVGMLRLRGDIVYPAYLRALCRRCPRVVPLRT